MGFGGMGAGRRFGGMGTPLGRAGGSTTVSLSLNFSTGSYVYNGKTYSDFASFLAASGSTFTRSSANGTYVDTNGVLQTASSDAARLNYDASYPRGNANPSLTGPFLLYEPAATNLFLRSNAFTTTWVALNGGTATAAQFTAPDGTNNGWSLTSGTGFGGINQAANLSNVAYAVSIWGKTITGTPALHLTLNDKDKTVSPALSSTLKRVAVTDTPTAGTNVNRLVYLNSASGNTAGIYGAQVETGSVATSYVATTTATATRAADALTVAVPSGLNTLTVTFDDNSVQLINSATGSYSLPTNLNRPNIKSLVWDSSRSLIEDTANDLHSIRKESIAKTAAAVPYDLYFEVARFPVGNPRDARLTLHGGDTAADFSTQAIAWFSLDGSYAPFNSLSGGFTLDSATVTDLGGGKQRIRIQGTTTAQPFISGYIHIEANSADTTKAGADSTYVGDGVSGLKLYKGWLELSNNGVNLFPSSDFSSGWTLYHATLP